MTIPVVKNMNIDEWRLIDPNWEEFIMGHKSLLERHIMYGRAAITTKGLNSNVMASLFLSCHSQGLVGS